MEEVQHAQVQLNIYTIKEIIIFTVLINCYYFYKLNRKSVLQLIISEINCFLLTFHYCFAFDRAIIPIYHISPIYNPLVNVSFLPMMFIKN